MPLTLDTSTEFGARVERRLRQEVIIWLTTVRADGLPQPSPVWFLWDGQTLLIYSRPNQPKLRNIARSPKVALHFDSDGQGGDIVIFDGEAVITPGQPPADRVSDYVAKYAAGIAALGLTPASFAAAYSVPIRVTLHGVRGH